MFYYRRALLVEFFGRHDLGLTSLATPLILGTKDHILIEDPEILHELDESKGNLELRN